MQTFDFFSPIEELHAPLYQEKGVRVYIKRDDLIHPYISGNKWRKLKYPLQSAQSKNKTLLVTFGGAWSNHLLATACAGAKFNFQTYGFVRGEEINNPVLALCKVFGMQLHFVDRESYKNKKVLFDQYFKDRPEAFFIDEGGYGLKAAQGCAEIIQELTEPFDHIFCACGTGTTFAGLIQGAAAQSLSPDINIHGVPVLKGGAFIWDEISELGATRSPYTHLHTDYHFGGYAKTKPELINYVKKFTRRTGILIEPTYTGKLCYAVEDLIAQDYFTSGSKIIILHTGGLTGFLGMFDKF
ncbi:pyridoxal-phosphate dependent enzyme [Sphingobacterium sp. UT-1RO-CII-1]|uniref:1-aminocyclopropane-1-carboxylate deaminase/D-cysteine desulfhydrase n=1 Tax=Sphingobacterium sp. UT-1RO-CII-1 TaxID=2995225 RepID=UPI00227A6030|nr:pyridoxal-phosphate dependent enzyme [Sphingobacterium sp. UT-1RO-CII-1]MCY4779115.1 pyridoxal-phosphate dependent enzyme [Sphingobacterium sp. UT-1RO-CII-1]